MSNPSSSFASTPEPPYFAVIFSSQRSGGDRGYDQVTQRMAALAAQQPGFLGIETVRGLDGFGITVSYWSTAEAITAWKQQAEHQATQESGKAVWYSDYQIRICHVQRAYSKFS